MKKNFLLIIASIFCLYLLWNLFDVKSETIYKESIKISDENNVIDNEDGIAEAQKLEFELTKDISLGYIPKYRLVNAFEDLMVQRQKITNSPNNISSLIWTERGPVSDITGPSNGNTRAGNGIASGRMRAVWVDLSDVTNHTVWVGGVDGGIWKTTDISAYPATWTSVNDFFANLSIGSICQDPTGTQNTMYFGTGEKTINADRVRGGGVWKSIDHGVSWNLLPATTGFWNVSKIVCDAAGIIYVATQGNNIGLQRSADGGNTWTNITPTGLNTAVTDMKLSSTGRMHIVCGYYNGYFNASPAGYRFTDNPATVTAATWTVATTVFPNVQYNCEMAVSGNTLYVLAANSSYQTPAIYKSIDGGDVWAATTTSPPAASGTNDLSSGQAWYNMALAVDPSNDLNVVAGGLNCYRTIDGGDTWTQISTWFGPGLSYVHADQQTAVWNGNQVLIGSDGGIFYSANSGATFKDRNAGLRIKQFYSCAMHPSNVNYFLAGAQDNGVHQFTNAGLGSTVEVTGGDGAFVQIDQDDPQYQFGSYVYNTYRRSTDGGASWNAINYSTTIGQFINPTDYDNVTKKMYASGSAGQYIRWEDAQTGSTFTPVSIAAFAGNVRHVSISPHTSNKVFFGTSSGKIVMVNNANATTPAGTDITGAGMPGSTVSCIAVGTNDNNLIATYSNYGATKHIWASSTGGGNGGWTNITGNFPDIPVRWVIFYPDDNTKAIIATEMGVFETTNINGASTVWTQNPTFPIVRTDMLKYRKSDGSVAAATHGRGLWTATIPLTIPYVRFAFNYNYQAEAKVTTSGCRYYKDYTINMKTDIAPTGDANITLIPSGTAVQGIDYDFTTNGNFASPSTVLTFANSTTTPKPVTIRIYDDAEMEGDESFTLNYSIGGGTNAQPAPGSLSYTFTIMDNDAVPTITPIDTILNHAKTEYLINNGTYYFYSTTTGDLINSITASSANLDCTSSNIFEAGDKWQSFFGGIRSQKVFEVIPSTNSGASYTIGLYYTAAELSGKDPAKLQIAKTTASTLAGINAGNTVFGTTALTPYGADYLFTASFTGFSKFFLVDMSVVLPVTILSFNGNLNNNNILLNWKTSSEHGSKYFELQKSADGTNFHSIGTINAAGNSSSIHNYNLTDSHVNEVNYYRLKMIDNDSRFTYSSTILIKNPNVSQHLWVNNPFHEIINIRMAKDPRQNIKVELVNMEGAKVYHKEFGMSNEIHINLSETRISSGVYLLKTLIDGKTYINKVVKQ
ncbi:MAG: T9SS type A sorting domain-containing protein [Ginsengibacter sp.]